MQQYKYFIVILVLLCWRGDGGGVARSLFTFFWSKAFFFIMEKILVRKKT